MHRGQSYRNKGGRPALTVLEGGREQADENLLPGTFRQKAGALLAILAIGVGMNGLLDKDMPKQSGLLNCNGQQEIPAGYASQSEAVVQNVSGIDNADEMTRIPVTLTDGETVPYGDLLPAGAPAGSMIPTDC